MPDRPEFDPSKPSVTAPGVPEFDPSKPATVVPVKQQPSIMQQVAHGFERPLVGLDVLASKIEQKLPFVSKETVARDVAAAETERQQFEKEGTKGFSWWDFLGQMANPANYLVPAGGAVGAFGRAASAAMGGAAAGMMEPQAAGDDYWSKKRGDVAKGAAVGTAGHLALGALGNVISPPLSADAARLSQEGVNLTPGQMGAGGGMVGRQIRRAEEAFKSFPILGSFIRSGEGRSIEDFNISTINQALEPIGQRLPRGTEAGHDAIELAATRIGNAYDRLLPGMTFRATPQFAADMTQLRTLVGEMPPAQAQQFENIVQNRLFQRLGPQGNMDGQTFKRVESELRALAEPYRRSPDAAQQQLGIALSQVRTNMRDALEQQNPQARQRLADINAAYAMLTRIEGAATRRAGGAATGVFTPMDLLSAVRSGDPSRRKRAFAHGDALFQDWAETAQRVLPGKLPDSGTPERAGYIGATLGLLGGEHYLGLPGGPETAIAAGLGSLPYTGIGQTAINALARNPYTQATRGALQQIGPYAAPGVATLVNRQ